MPTEVHGPLETRWTNLAEEKNHGTEEEKTPQELLAAANKQVKGQKFLLITVELFLKENLSAAEKRKKLLAWVLPKKFGTT